jgi:hypothetical protein
MLHFHFHSHLQPIKYSHHIEQRENGDGKGEGKIGLTNGGEQTCVAAPHSITQELRLDFYFNS